MDVPWVPHACIEVGPNNLLLNLDDHCHGTKGPGNEIIEVLNILEDSLLL